MARETVVVLTYDATISGAMWLMADYLPEVAALDHQIFPPPEQLAEWIGGDVRIDKLPIPCDTPDWMLGSFFGLIRSGCSTRPRERRHLVLRACPPTLSTVLFPKYLATWSAASGTSAMDT